MAKLRDKIKTALDEGRMLMLGSQILVGFQYRSVFESGFEKLSHTSQVLKMCGLGLMLIATALLMWPGAYHRIVAGGEDHPDVHQFITRVMCFALLPFAFAFGIDAYVVTDLMYGHTTGIVFGACLTTTALLFWYGIEELRKRRRESKEERMKARDEDEDSGKTKLEDKIDHVLTECRVVLPGAQALMGFQFISFLMQSFEKLPQSSKLVHTVSLCFMALSVILLMAPAAYHRIVEEGEDTEHFHRVASSLLIAAMIPLALGISGDFFIVVRKVTESTVGAIAASAVMLLIFYGLWFGYTSYRRTQEQGSRQKRRRESRELAKSKG
ncbi:MAG: hypothetical protein AUG51_20685 [Acidobacteria bacterium 13_1_20CM_3_53_8]|nr:MAG: hypothetical protein AUG51_20685 [Acidobacteria bacterium 13_1_20CM_3_53_8]